MPTISPDRMPTTGLLGRAYNKLSAEIFDRVRSAGAADIRPSHGNVMEQLTIEHPLRLTDIAQRSGITAQSAGALVDELEELGYVERRPDPGDRRAKLIHLTAKGRRNADLAFDIVKDIEEELEHRLGRRSLAQLRRALIAITQTLR
ncbi:MAG TPA: MarR family transcriptional regulator [Actinomycetota bacterium]|nr:MarR family transcriptional regulator [Actinomycetota bacterium]